MGWLAKLIRLAPMEPTIGSRAARIATVGLFSLIASVCAIVLWAFPRQDRLATERDARMRTTQGTINSTEVTHWKGKRRSYWELEVWYSYGVDGKAYIGNSIGFHDSSRKFPTEEEVRKARAPWADGASVTVFYDSANPDDSALDPQWKPVTFLVPWAAVIGVLSLLAAFSIGRTTLREARRSPIPPAEITRALRNARNVCAVLGGAAFVLLAVHVAPIAFHHLAVKPRLVTAKPIFFWDLDVHNGPPTPVSKYRFRPEGREDWIEGTAWRFGYTGLTTLEEAEAEKERLDSAHRDDQLRVFYLASDPERCALTPGHGGVLPRSVWLAAAAGLLLTGPLALLSARALRRRPVEAAPVPTIRTRRSRRRPGGA